MFAPVGRNGSLYSVIDRDFALAAGAFSGKMGSVAPYVYAAAYINKEQYVRIYELENGYSHLRLKVSPATSALVAADFAGEGVALGNPTHIVKDNDVSYMVVLQGAPYHVDNISEDGKSLTKQPVNYSYHKDMYTSYETASSSSEGSTTTFDIHNTVETIFALDQNSANNLIGGNKKIKTLSGLVKTFAGFVPQVNKTLGYVDKFTNFIDSCVDKVESIKQGFDSSVSGKTTMSSLTARRADVIRYVSAPQNIWRYPIVADTVPTWKGYYDAIDKYVAKQDFLTFTLYDEVSEKIYEKTDLYQPRHETGNLFSYPSSLENIDGYDSKNALSPAKSKQIGVSDADEMAKFDYATEHQETESKQVSTGFITNTANAFGSLFNKTLIDVPQNETGPTYTRKNSTSEQVRFHFPSTDGARLLHGYTVEFAAYTLENGAIANGFAVKGLDRDKNLFNSYTSLYGTKPDPSFVLPYKFVVGDTSSSMPGFIVNPSRAEAMTMKGVRFYAKDYNQYTSNALLAGLDYRVEIPLYNASFKEANGVKVNLYWVTNKDPSATKNKIGTSGVINMSGWSADGTNEANNKGWARIDFTPSKTNTKDGNYYFYAEIEYSGDEVHKTRSEDDPGGNNRVLRDLNICAFRGKASRVSRPENVGNGADVLSPDLDRLRLTADEQRNKQQET